MGTTIMIAAVNSSAADKQRADAVCGGFHDEQTINRQIERMTHGGTLQLLDGDYYIDAFDSEDNTAVYFGYNDGRARTIHFIGDTENKAYNTRYGVTLHVTKAALDSLPDGETGHVFYGTGRRPDEPGVFFTMTYVNNVNFTNFYLRFDRASKPFVGIDCSHFGCTQINQVGIFTERYFLDRFLHEKPETPCKGTVGIRSNRGSSDEMAKTGCNTIDIGGLYIGFEFVGGDHMILEVCAACRCCYGYYFAEHSAKTLTLINCCDEGNTHLPYFGKKGQITMLDFNIERFDPRYICDDPDGNTEPYAVEETPGSWHGILTYTMQGSAFGLKKFWKSGHGIGFRTFNQYHDGVSRPSNPEFLETYFDRDTKRTLTWTGEEWVDAMGNPVA